MDPNRIIQALKGTIDPNLRIAAETELNQVGALKEVYCFVRESCTHFPQNNARVYGSLWAMF